MNPGTLLAGEERIKTRLTDLRWMAGHHRPLKFGRDIASGLCERTLLQAVFAGAARVFCPAMIVDGDRGSNTECGCCQYIGGGHGLHQKWRCSASKSDRSTMQAWGRIVGETDPASQRIAAALCVGGRVSRRLSVGSRYDWWPLDGERRSHQERTKNEGQADDAAAIARPANGGRAVAAAVIWSRCPGWAAARHRSSACVLFCSVFERAEWESISSI